MQTASDQLGNVTEWDAFLSDSVANPGLTIQALAARTADYLISQGDSVFTSNDREMTSPPIRRNLVNDRKNMRRAKKARSAHGGQKTSIFDGIRR